MPAKTKQELLAISGKEFAKLNAVIETVPADFALQKDDDDTSIKDVIGHRAHWIELFLGWYADGKEGKFVHFPAEGYKWNELKRYNAALRARQADMGWQQARALLNDKHDALLEMIGALGDNDLYGGPMQGARNDWTTGRWAEATGPSHYRSATKYIRARLKQQR